MQDGYSMRPSPPPPPPAPPKNVTVTIECNISLDDYIELIVLAEKQAKALQTTMDKLAGYKMNFELPPRLVGPKEK